MKKRRIAVGMVFVTFTALCILGQLGCNKGAESICRISQAKGEVTVKKTAAQAATKAERGQSLFAGDKVLTGANGIALLKFADTARVKLMANSAFVVNTVTKDAKKGIVQASSELLKGMGLVRVNPGKATGFTVKTPHVVTGVLGTCYGIECDGVKTTITVVEGTVKVTEPGGNTFELKALQFCEVGKDLPPGIAKKIKTMQAKMPQDLTSYLKEKADQVYTY